VRRARNQKGKGKGVCLVSAGSRRFKRKEVLEERSLDLWPDGGDQRRGKGMVAPIEERE